ncbi:maltotransferase domain-containing protein, partial [Streptomyces sp. NPDC001480]|uniref:maltotransferase domain-containing protein n=1 Tax=Streptomyces sp. NPDC001480 TaxID=3364577 RepID=UPI0036AA2AFA
MPATHHSSPPPTNGKPTSRTAGKKSTKPRAPAGADAGVPAGAPPASPQESSPQEFSPQEPAGGTVVGRIPVLDVRPVVQRGHRPAKAVTGETFEISATVFREGHDAVAANVVLRDPEGRPGPWTPMRELAPGTDRWGAE